MLGKGSKRGNHHHLNCQYKTCMVKAELPEAQSQWGPPTRERKVVRNARPEDKEEFMRFFLIQLFWHIFLRRQKGTNGKPGAHRSLLY